MKRNVSKKMKPKDSDALHPRKCSKCGRDISKEICAQCCRCINFFLCLECYSVCSECKTHNRTHQCVVIEQNQNEVFQEGWTVEEEAVLLFSIQSCGLGNWHSISEAVKTKSPVECECHYFDTFFSDGARAPAPGDGVLSPSVLPPPPSYNTAPRESRPSVSHEKNLAQIGKKEKTTPAEFAGWMPRRREFETEYANDAEQLISGIAFSETAETPASFSRKMEQLRTYNELLAERHRRIDFALEYGMLDGEVRGFRGASEVERKFEERMLPFAQVVPRDALVDFLQTYDNEVRVKEKIMNFRKWTENGIATVDEGALFEKLEALLKKEKITQADVNDWNSEVFACMESLEFRSTVEMKLLSSYETELCKSLGISPHSYLRIKDLMMREYTVHGDFTEEQALELLPQHQHVMQRIYNSLREQGYFA